MAKAQKINKPKNADYWEKRFTKLQDTLLKRTEKYKKDNVTSDFQRAMADIDKQLAQWYQRFADNNGGISMAEAKKLLTSGQLKELQWDVDQYVKEASKKKISKPGAKRLENASAKFHISRLEAIQLQIQMEIEKLYGRQVDGMQAELESIYKEAYDRAAFEVDKGFGVNLSFGLVNTKKAYDIVMKPWAADKKTFSERLWRDKKALNTALKEELSNAVLRGDDYATATKRLKDRMGVATSSAARIVMTEAAFFGTKGQMDCFKYLGVDKYEYVATLDSKTSVLCQDLDGKVFELSKYKPGTNAPPMHCWCRSCVAPSFDDDFEEDIEQRAARDPDTYKTVMVPGDITYKDWKNVFVDKKLTEEAWSAQNIFFKKVDVLTNAIGEKNKEIAQISADMAAIDTAKQYPGIWYNSSPTILEWEQKKDSVQKKIDFYDQEMSKSGKTQSEINDLQDKKNLVIDFNNQGKKYNDIKLIYDEAKKLADDLQNELDLLLNPNSKKKRTSDAFSQARKDAAQWFTPKNGGFYEADKYYDPPAIKLHNAATYEEQHGFYTYTSGSGGHNRPLAGFRKPYGNGNLTGWEECFFVGQKKVWINYEGKGAEIRGLTTLIERSIYDKDCWLQSGQDFRTAEGLLGIPYGTLAQMSEHDLQQYIGTSKIIPQFISTAVNKGGGSIFNRKPMKFNIYCPKGTQMLYASDRGAYGKGENEMILQRGGTYEITKIYWGNDPTDGNKRKLFIDMEVHPEVGYDLFQQDDTEWTGPRDKYK